MANVLLLEPDAESARTYSECLQRAGFRVGTDIPEAERPDTAPHVVVLSVPRLEGSLTRVIARGQPVPRIVVSSEPADAERALAFDVAAILIRPVMYDDLVREVRRVLKRVAEAQPA